MQTLLCLAASIGAVLPFRDQPEPEFQPSPGDYNVLLVVLDDVGTDYLSMYSPSPRAAVCADGTSTCPARTPFLDSIAQNGVKFSRAYVDPMCSPTRAMILSGRHGVHTGMVNLADPYALPDEELLIPELIQHALDGGPVSYAAGAFGKWHLATASDPCHPCRNGFDVFDGTVQNNGGALTGGGTSTHFVWDRIGCGGTPAGDCSTPVFPTCTGASGPTQQGSFPATVSTYDGSVVQASASAWIQSLNSPFFCHVAFHAPHHPVQVPPLALLSQATRDDLRLLGIQQTGSGYLAQAQYTDADRFSTGQDDDFERKRKRTLFYKAMLEATDTNLANLWASIPSEEQANTMLIVIGDNGTPHPMSFSPFGDGYAKRSLYEGGCHVPLLVAGPLVGTAGSTCDRLISGVDLWRTVANICGVDNSAIDTVVGCLFPAPGLCPQAHDVDSSSFLHLIEDPTAAAARDFAYAELGINPTVPPQCPAGSPPSGIPVYGTRMITDGRFKLVRKGASGSTVEELYDLDAFPFEQPTLNLIGLPDPTFGTRNMKTVALSDMLKLAELQTEMTTLSGP
ncbi:MAG: sulfatase-like hydrolase/transferase [Vicinamibacterales bacterium]